MSRLGAPLAIRTRLLWAVLAAMTIILVALVTAFNLVLRSTLDGDATSVAQARAAAVISTLGTSGGHVRSREAPDDAALDARVWVFDGARVIEGPRTSMPVFDAAAARAATNAPAVADAGGALRLASAPVSSGGQTLGAVVAGVPLAPYRSTTRAALIGSVALAVALLAAIAAIAVWTLRRALRPVHEMTRLASEWSERDLDRRFALGPPRDELTELAATLDALLGRLAASLRRERRFSAELAHELRTPLARISAECELALDGRVSRIDDEEPFQAIAHSADEMRRTIEVLVAAARHGAGHDRGVATVADIVERLVHRAREAAGGAIEVRAKASVAARIGVDADLAERIVEPIVSNALRYATRHLTITTTADASFVVITVGDDGPGVPLADQGRIFDAGMRGEEARGNGAGLGLALARRLAVDVGGGIDLDPTAIGARFSVRLPRV